MSFFSKRPVALLLALVIICASSFASAKYGIEERSREIEEQFYYGTEKDGYTQKSIYEMLENRMDAANGLLSVARKQSGVEDEFDALKEAKEYMNYSGSPLSYYYSNEDLDEAFYDLVNALNALDLDSRDEKAIEEYTSTFKSAAKVISKSEYNSVVRDFYNNVVYKFPASIIYDNYYIETPDYFGTMYW